MKDFFEGIAWLFENVLFIPFDALRKLQLDSWLLANFMNWIFMLIGASAFIYWMLQLKKFDDQEKAQQNDSQRSTLS